MCSVKVCGFSYIRARITIDINLISHFFDSFALLAMLKLFFSRSGIVKFSEFDNDFIILKIGHYLTKILKIFDIF